MVMNKRPSRTVHQLSSSTSRLTVVRSLSRLGPGQSRFHAAIAAVRSIATSTPTRPTPYSAASAGVVTMSKPPSIPWSTLNKPEDKSNPADQAKTSKKPAKAPASPSPSSSVILVSPTNQVLLLHRVQTSSSFPSAHVFPGGNLEASDGHVPPGQTDPLRHQDSMAYRTGAIRELFEESGILLARETSSPSSPLFAVNRNVRLKGRNDIHSGNITITSWLHTQSPSAVLDTDGLIPFTRWITPTNVPKRFTTQMYIYFLPVAAHDSESLVAISDEVETMAPEWRRAEDWVSRARSGEIILFPPQFILLSFVSQFLDRAGAGDVTEDEMERRRDDLKRFVTEDGNPPWRDKIISPTALSFTRKDGRTALGLDKPGPELRGVESAKGDDTRVVLVRFSKEGPRDVDVRFRKDVMEEERKEKESKL